MSAERYSAPTAAEPLDAVVTLPGSKSLTNRELVLSALAAGPSRLRAPLRARDTELMADALRTLGATIDELSRDGAAEPLGHDEHDAEGSAGAPEDWVIGPIGVDAAAPEQSVAAGSVAVSRTVDVGLAGTVMRFVPPIAALAAGDVTFDGDAAARERPMATTIDSLRKLGVEVTAAEGDRLPFTLRGTGRIRGGEIEIDASASSQFVSGLLLAAPRFELGLVLRHTGERLPSMPHIEMTIECLRARGVEVGSPEPGVWSIAPQPIAGRDVAVEPDLSNAAPFLAAALVAGGRVTVPGWPLLTTQPGGEVPELFRAFGGRVHRDGDRCRVEAGPRGITGAGSLELGDVTELVPTLAALAALADSPTTLTGIGHMRGHETDRLAALAAEINGLGGEVTELDDGLAIRPRPLTGGLWRSYGDHRMATTGALLGLVVPGVVIDDLGVVSKTMPEFRRLWERMLGR